MAAGPNDSPTLTEPSVTSLYSQAISIPFAGRIRTSSDMSLNGLDLGPDYDLIERHVAAVINDSNLT